MKKFSSFFSKKGKGCVFKMKLHRFPTVNPLSGRQISIKPKRTSFKRSWREQIYQDTKGILDQDDYIVKQIEQKECFFSASRYIREKGG